MSNSFLVLFFKKERFPVALCDPRPDGASLMRLTWMLPMRAWPAALLIATALFWPPRAGAQEPQVAAPASGPPRPASSQNASSAVEPVTAPPAIAPQSALSTPELPLRAGVVPADPPFVVRDRGDQLSGFSVALFRAIAARLKRDVTFSEAPLPALQSALAAGHLDVLPGPIPATPEHAADLLFTEGYIWEEDQFGSRAGATINSLADLRGKRLAVQTDSEYAGWADRNRSRVGFTTLAVPTLSAVFEAVRDGRADASLSDSAALRGAVARTPQHGPALSGGLSLPETRTQMAIAVAQDSVDLRDEIDDALRCLKLDGTVAKLSAAWFGGSPGPEDLENMVIPGDGVPGLSGYDPKPRKSHC
jgi:polar amino acid transport system substrate-binding protein